MKKLIQKGKKISDWGSSYECNTVKDEKKDKTERKQKIVEQEQRGEGSRLWRDNIKKKYRMKKEESKVHARTLR